MNLSKQETIKRHRQMWNWIADESLKQKRCVRKSEVFEHFKWKKCWCYCWCCEYSNSECARCPILWLTCEKCVDPDSLYKEWINTCHNNNYLKASELAKQIANLPERKFEGEEE